MSTNSKNAGSKSYVHRARSCKTAYFWWIGSLGTNRFYPNHYEKNPRSEWKCFSLIKIECAEQ